MDSFEETISETRELLERIESQLPHQFEIPYSRSKIPMKVVVLRECFLFRMHDLGRSAVILLDQDCRIPAYVLVRSILETMAYFYMFFEKVEEVDANKSTGDINEFLEKMMVSFSGTAERNYMPREAMKRIETIIPNFYEHYQFYCDFAHPNTAGLIGAYSAFDRNTTTVTFSLDVPHEGILQTSWGIIYTTLDLFLIYYNNIPSFMQTVIGVCEEELKDVPPPTE
jgi:hypothetical protein